MGTAIILVAVAAAIGVGLVVFGTVRSQQAASPQESVRASYRTLADVREQLRRRFDPTGTPTWVASDDRTSKLQRDLVSADLELRPYEFRLIQAGVALVLAVVGLLRFGIGAEFLVLAVIGYVVPSLYLRNRRGHRLREFDAALPRTMELIANSMKAGQSVAQSLSAVIITLLPIAAALLLYFFVQDYFRPMLTNPIGWVMLVFAGFLLFIGNVIIRRLTAIA